MAEESFRFRCSKCRQLLGSSYRRIGTVISCPRCGAELRVPRPEEQTAEVPRAGQGVTAQSRAPVTSGAPASQAGGNDLPAFMQEIAAAIPDDLASLRPEDIRVEAEFVNLVVTPDSTTSSTPTALEPRFERAPGDPDESKWQVAQTPPPTEPPPAVRSEPPPAVRSEPPPAVRSEPRPVESPVDPTIEAVLPAIRIETPSLLPPGRQLQPVSEVILQPATVLAWSLLVLMALPMAFLAGLLLGHFVWR